MNVVLKSSVKQYHLLYQHTLEQFPQAIVWIDADGLIFEVNTAACQLLGYSYNELQGTMFSEFLRKEDTGDWEKIWQTCEEQKVASGEYALITKGKAAISYECVLSSVQWEGWEGCCLVLRDITKQKRVEQELRDSQQQLERFVNNLPCLAYRCQPDFELEFVSEWDQSITGYSREYIVHHKQALFDLIHPDDREAALAQLWDALDNQRPGEAIYRIITAGGDIKWVHERAHGVYADDGTLLAIEGFFTDITEHIEREHALQQALNEVDRLKNRLAEENIYLRQEIQTTHNFENIICQSDIFKQVLRHVEHVASTDATVLILGETGTGKELIARAVHTASGRRNRTLVKVNCAGLPVNLIESELFGYEKGAFTGAVTSQKGRFELADEGTIFLDEIGELPLELQAKLLRVLQEGQFERIGNPRTLTVDTRIIAATNRNLEEAIAQGTFREDLYYRLNVFPIHLPPLRERPEDIPVLVEYLLQKYCAKTGKYITTVPQCVMEELQNYHWPGNVRELENIIERAVILSHGLRLKLGDWLLHEPNHVISPSIRPLEEIERTHILKALEFTEWRVSGDKGAAKLLHLNPYTLFSKMRKLNIKRPI